MYVGLKNIQHQLSEYSTYLTSSDSLHCLTGWTKFQSAPKPYNSHILYAGTMDMFKDVVFDGDIHILCSVPDESYFELYKSFFPENVSALFVVTDYDSKLYTELQQYFHIQSGVGMYGQTLLEFLSFGDSLQEAVNYSFNVFHNPIFVFDTNYNLIAATWKAINELNIGDQVIKNKGFSDIDFKMANKDHFHDKVLRSEVPISRFNPDLGYDQMVCAVNTEKNLGHIVVSAVNQPLEPIDFEFMLMLKKFINLVLSHDTFTRNAKGFNYEYFIKDLLDEKIKADRIFSERTEYIKQEFSGNMYCFVIETARSINVVKGPLLRNIVESRFPNSKVLLYNGQVVCILSFHGKQLIPNEYRKIAQTICQEQGVYAGLSNCFQNILELAEYYNQALRSIELGIRTKPDPDLFCYDDYYMDHLVNIFLQKHQARAFCHPKMQFLLDYDKKHKTELAYTMYIYLTHERNLTSAAEAMDMHRTSLVYRFKKIDSLIGDDFEDYKERMYMILSYEMNAQEKE